MKETSTRETAIAWFKSLSMKQQSIAIKNSNIACKEDRSIDSLTGREIEEIWRKETKAGSDREIIEEVFPDLKPNQKQFKEFDKSLFLSYINKFSDEDKVTAFEVLFENSKKWDSINNASPFYMSICRAYNAGKQSILNQKSAKDKGDNPDKFFVSSDKYFKIEFGFE